MPLFPHEGSETDLARKGFVQPRFLYLHGFASSPGSRKARFFAEKLGDEGITVDVPALDGGEFESLTITKQLDLARRQIGSDEVVLIGSSLGGYLAALLAARLPQVRRVLLLAPAFGFYDLWKERLGPERLALWKRQRTLGFYHYGLGREAALGYELVADAETYESEPKFDAPALIIHGNQDEVVPVQCSIEYASKHPNAELVRLDAGHELTEVLEPIWERAKPFLQGG